MSPKIKTNLVVAASALMLLLGVFTARAWDYRDLSSVNIANLHQSNEIVVSNLDNEEYLPSAAFNWKHNEYLVVWHTTWVVETRDVRGARLSDTGQVLETFVIYGEETRDNFQPSVAYDPVNDRYLVAWVRDAFGDGSDNDLYGRLIPWDGPIGSLQAFPICTWSTHQWAPKVEYGRAVEEFLVVWSNEYQAGTPPMYISARRVTASNGAFPGGDSDLTISHVSEYRINPDVTYNLARNEYLVVYDNTVDIFGIRLTGDLSHNFGGEFGIAGWPDTEIHPAVAACREADQYFVTWQSDQGSSNDAIYGRYIAGDGTVGSVLKIDDTTSPERESDVACNQAGTQYLVSWQTGYTNSRFGIWGRQVVPNGSMETGFAIVHPGSDADRTEPVVAGGHNHYLVVWEHDRDGTAYQDIHGRIVTPIGLFIPMIQRNYK